MRLSIRVAVASAVAAAVLTAGTMPAQAFTRYLEYGDSGQDVKCWQTAYNAWDNYSYATNKLTVDGVFGTNTRYATERFQYIYGDNGKYLTVDGIVGPATSQAMSDALQDVEAYGTSSQAQQAHNAFVYCGTMLPG
ncbi:MAG TPA: peptidoglycan-binding domain-containing protein [Jatrophihabitans sp.]|nr:peptidoglycan-binding domain-containing protein [Jatrophihabitans sp.]